MNALLPRLPYREVWVVDFEFIAEPGERPDPVCLVARELLRCQLVRLWRDELSSRPPYSVAADSLFVAYFASAEIGCHLKLGWPVPPRVLDLYTEFRNRTNNIPDQPGNGLIDALTYFGENSMGAAHKESMRNLVLGGGHWSGEERRMILDYCQEDVEGTVRLFERMTPELELAFALIRGRYMSAVARMEHQGIPIDCDFLELLRAHWEDIKAELVTRVDAHFGVYDEEFSFRTERFLDYLARRHIQWPRLGSGAPDLTDDTFKRMAEVLPELAPLRELRKTLSQLHPDKLQVGRDGYNRCLLSPFRSKTGRNQPSNSKYIFGQACWVRHLIKPPPG
jgi:DNA polymerase I